jgi:DNA-binding CsgD family transcriptional regulator
LLKDNTGIPLLAYIQFTDITESAEPKEFKIGYSGRNGKGVKFPSKKPLTYKKGNCLTDREKQILLYIVDGYTNREIARLLNITEATVNKHRNNILEKTGQHNYAGLIKWARKNL